MRARKRFGQHFLNDAAVLDQIVTRMNIGADDHIVEIGPGQGALTQYLLAQTDELLAIEIDRDLVPLLQARFATAHIVNTDVLQVDLGELLADRSPVRLVGNLPYNISSPLLLKLAALQRTHPGLLRDGHFMLQREMAQRMAAVPGTKAWGRLSVMLQLDFVIEHLFDVGPESFSPPPKVWSSVVRLIPRPASLLPNPGDIAVLDDVLRRAFGGRRKRLANSLQYFDIDWQQSTLDPDLRADDVTLQAFIDLVIHLRSRPSAKN